MRTMNEAVKDRIGDLSLSLCEAEVVIADREARIAELETELEALKAKPSKRSPTTKRGQAAQADSGSGQRPKSARKPR